MTDTMHGAKPGNVTPEKESAGGCGTTTADTNTATQTIALSMRIKAALIRFASWLAVVFRGVS